MYFVSLLTLYFGLNCVYGANILFVAPVPSPSHHIWNKALTMALIAKGHNITMIGHDDNKSPIPNFNMILFEDVYEKLHEEYNYEDLYNSRPIVWITDIYEYIDVSCKLDMETEGLKTLLKYPEDFFDLIIFDATCGQCLYPIIDHFKRPVVAVTAFLLPNYLSNAMGNHWYPSYMPHYGITATNRMSFKDRISSFFFKNIELFLRNHYYATKYQKLAEDYFGKQIRPLESYEKDFTLLLANTDPLLDFPMALPPNIIPVGGLHAQPSKTLPNDLKQIMDDAKDGVILFSLGTNVRSDLLPKELLQTIMKTLGKFKQTVLWKFESKIEGLPKNVIIREWLPQNDMFGHPNMKLFISHGGALSTQEAMYHGVPLLGMPFFCDQYNNIGKMVARKLALFVDHKTLTADDFYEKINQLLTNPMYSKNMKEISEKFKDQPQTPAERGVFWVEHVLKHGPLKEYALPTNDMNIIQIYSLDVMAFITCIIGAILLVIVKLFKCICCRKRANIKVKRN